MNTEPTITPEQIHYVLETVEYQVRVAMMLSAATMLALFMILAFVFHFRKVGLAIGISWGVLTTMIPNGHSQMIGPIAAVACLVGLVFAFMGPEAAKKKA